MKNYYYALWFSILLVGCNQGSSDVEREYIKNLEAKNKALEKELQEKENESKGNSEENSNHESAKQKNKIPKDYFTIGSTENEVLDVMGDPTSIMAMGSFGKIFHYELSSITFRDGKVVSYDNMDRNLKVKMRR